MKLSISNIAFDNTQEEVVFPILKKYSFKGIEIAPTKICNNPYFNVDKALVYKKFLKENDFEISSIQSIWYGINQRIFYNDEEREFLIEYTKNAIDYASKIGCKNLVFGCPKNRKKDIEYSESVAVKFFNEIGDYAKQREVYINIEANPSIYGTDFINKTSEAVDFIRKADSKGLGLNLDLGTMIYYDEGTDILKGNSDVIKHIHISEPMLNPIEKRRIHFELIKYLESVNYSGYISLEMKKQDDTNILLNSIKYVGDLFYGL